MAGLMLALALTALPAGAQEAPEAPSPPTTPTEDPEAGPPADPETDPETEAEAGATPAEAPIGDETSTESEGEATDAAETAPPAEAGTDAPVVEEQPQNAPEAAAGEGADEDTADEDADEPAPERVFSDVLKQALVLELEVQAQEWELLGGLDPETLNDHQARRLERMTADTVEFKALEGQFSVEPLPRPSPKPGLSLSADELVVLEQLGTAYDASRQPRTLQRYIDLNRKFVESNDWSRRDAAVRARDEILQREVAYLTLFSQGFQVSQGEGSPEMVEEITAALNEISPKTMASVSSVAVMILDNEELRQSVLEEVMTWAAADTTPQEQPRSANQLIADVQTLQLRVLEDSGLTATVAEITTLNTDIDELKADLNAQAFPTLDERRAATARLVEMRKRRNELTREWYSADPGETADRLVHTYDRLIRTRMSDMGPKGALFGARFDALDRTRDNVGEDPIFVWRLLEEQEELLSAIEEAQPTTSPMRGLAPPPDTDAFQVALQQARAKAGFKGPVTKKAPPKKFAGSKSFHKGKVPGTGTAGSTKGGGKKKKKKGR